MRSVARLKKKLLTAKDQREFNAIAEEAADTIIENGGKQYKIEEGKKVRLEKFAGTEGDEVKLENVLAVNTGEATLIGSPYVSGAYINGKVVAQGRDKKITVFKHKRRKDYKVKKGHRQPYTELLVEKIVVEA